MKKLIVIAFMLLASVSFAEDVELGKVVLTKNQVEHLSEVKGFLEGEIKGIAYWEDGRVVVVTSRDLTNKEKTDLIKQLKELSDEPTVKPKTAGEKIDDLEKRVEALEKK